MSRRSYISPVNNANAANGQNGHSEAAAGDRLSKFTEYRGEDMMMPHAQDINQEPRRPTQTDLERERVRGQSLPPGATIENIRDFYKSSQYSCHLRSVNLESRYESFHLTQKKDFCPEGFRRT